MSLLSTPYAVVMGLQAGYTGQSTGAVAIGFGAGATGQKVFGVAVGPRAGLSNQGTGAVAIGWSAGDTTQAPFSVAIGAFAGQTQAANSIVLNASATGLNASSGGLYISPINIATSDVNPTLLYDSSTSNVIYRPVGLTATRLNVYPMTILTPTMTAATTAGVGGNYTASASSQFSAAYAAWKAFDNNGSDGWATAGVTSNIWLQIQLPTARNFAYVWFQGRYSTEYPLTFKIQGSNDGSTFTDLTSVQNCGNAYFNWYTTCQIPIGSRNYLYYRFFLPTNVGPNPGLGEVLMFTPSTTAYPNSVNAIRTVNQGGYSIFNNCTQQGGWGFSFTSRGGYVLVEVSMSAYNGTINQNFSFNVYIDGTYQSRSQFVNWVPQWMFMNDSRWKQMPTISWGGLLEAGDHVISFDSLSTTGWAADQVVNFNVIEIL